MLAASFGRALGPLSFSSLAVILLFVTLLSATLQSVAPLTVTMAAVLSCR